MAFFKEREELFRGAPSLEPTQVLANVKNIRKTTENQINNSSEAMKHLLVEANSAILRGNDAIIRGDQDQVAAINVLGGAGRVGR